MRRTILAALGGLAAALMANFAAAQPPSRDPADLPFYMVQANCNHHDGDTCDNVAYPPPDFNPLIGSWQRVSILRNGFSLQPPEAPLNIKFMEDGYFSELELPDSRLKVNKPIAQQTPKELLGRFDRVAGSWGKYSQIGMWNWRRHEVRLVPSYGGIQPRQWRFEGNALILEGVGATHSPIVTFMKLPRQPLDSTALTGSWQRIAYTVNGVDAYDKTPEILLLGGDGWFTRTHFPPGRKGLPSENALRLGNALDNYTVTNYAEAYSGVTGARGTYNVTANILVVRHIGDVDPTLQGKLARGTYTRTGDTFIWEGTDVDGRKFRSTYAKLTPFDIRTPVPAGAPGAPAAPTP
jgi:hypothetical protein